MARALTFPGRPKVSITPNDNGDQAEPSHRAMLCTYPAPPAELNQPPAYSPLSLNDKAMTMALSMYGYPGYPRIPLPSADQAEPFHRAMA